MHFHKKRMNILAIVAAVLTGFFLFKMPRMSLPFLRHPVNLFGLLVFLTIPLTFIIIAYSAKQNSNLSKYDLSKLRLIWSDGFGKEVSASQTKRQMKILSLALAVSLLSLAFMYLFRESIPLSPGIYIFVLMCYASAICGFLIFLFALTIYSPIRQCEVYATGIICLNRLVEWKDVTRISFPARFTASNAIATLQGRGGSRSSTLKVETADGEYFTEILNRQGFEQALRSVKKDKLLTRTI